jgi:prolyl 4-hydroxylase
MIKRSFFIVAVCLMRVGVSFELKTLCEAPRIYLIENFLTDQECEYIIEKAEPQLKRSTVLDDKPEGAIDQRRSSRGMFFQANSPDSILKRIEKKVFAIAGIPMENGESLQVLHYGIGGEYQPHYDYFIASMPGGSETLKRGGQRVATCIMYLNTPKEGGETIFPLAKVSVTPKKGQAILFYNMTQDGKEDPQSLHGGAPVIKGEKWIATKWMRERAFN